jgi:hypothetical protein
MNLRPALLAVAVLAAAERPEFFPAPRDESAAAGNYHW